MPPRRLSRYALSTAYRDEAGAVLLTEPEPFRFRTLADTRMHVASDGDTLYGLAGRYFRPLARPSGLWWIIADFQPSPIIDPTIALEGGRHIFIPSVRAVTETILNEARRGEGQ